MCALDAFRQRPRPSWAIVDPRLINGMFRLPDTFGKDDKELAKNKFQVFYIGVDEVGVGPWAGPLLACAFYMKRRKNAMSGVRDSKLIKDPFEMKSLHNMLTDNKDYMWALGEVSSAQLDEEFQGDNHKARLFAMTLAVRALQAKLRVEAANQGMSPFWKLLIDGDRMPVQLNSSVTQIKLIVKGDATVLEISAASIIAKWTRDEQMRNIWAKRFPQYGFEQHKGYGVPEHIRALYKYGPSPCHRWSFNPIRLFQEARLKQLPNPYKLREKKEPQKPTKQTSKPPKLSKEKRLAMEKEKMNELARTAIAIQPKIQYLPRPVKSPSEID